MTRVLMRHQIQALSACHSKPKRPSPEDVFGYLMETGCGKTQVVLEEFQHGKLDLFVAAPAGSYKNWYRDKSDEQPAEIRAGLRPEFYAKLSFAGWETGSRRAERECEELLDARGRRALFVNIEALSTVQRLEDLCEKFLRRGPCMMVVDESTKIRARKAERAKTIRRLGKLARARRIMSGLVQPRSPMDLFWQFYFLDPRILGFDTFSAFRARYAVVERECYEPTAKIDWTLQSRLRVRDGQSIMDTEWLRRTLGVLYQGRVDVSRLSRARVLLEIEAAADGLSRAEKLAAIEAIPGKGWVRQVPRIKEYRNLPELRQKIAPYVFQVLKKDCLDLEPKTYLPPREVAMTKEQTRVYGEMRERALAELRDGGIVHAKSVVAQMMRLHQIVCGHAREENTKKLVRIDSNREEAVKELLEEHDGKAIVWSCYRPQLDYVASALEKEWPGSVAQFHGGNIGARDKDERRFLSDPECRFMASTQAAGGMGNTWNVATLAVYAANSYDLEHRFQSEDRCHRKGQTNRVTYADLLCPGTVEERILHALRKKIDLMTAITGENYREWLI